MHDGELSPALQQAVLAVEVLGHEEHPRHLVVHEELPPAVRLDDEQRDEPHDECMCVFLPL